jgi:Ca-activated chloride channel family protein
MARKETTMSGGALNAHATRCLALVLTICSAICAPQQIFGSEPVQAASASSHVAAETTAVRPFPAFQPIRTSVDLVLFDVNVFDATDRMVTGLRKEDFVVLEDRRIQRLEYFSAEDVPLSVGLILDVSGSMEDKIEKGRLAIAQLLRNANPADEYFLITFNDRLEKLSGFTHAFGMMLDKVNSVKPSGQTALIDAIHLGWKEMQNAKHDRRTLLIISDGGDNHSRHTAKELQKDLRERGVQLYSIGIYSHLSSASSGKSDGFWNSFTTPVCYMCEIEREGQRLLTKLVKMTGGLQFNAGSVEELPEITRSVDQIMRSAYLLGYTPTNRKHDGKWRKIQVRVDPSSAIHTKLRVLYKDGYYAPKE